MEPRRSRLPLLLLDWDLDDTWIVAIEGPGQLMADNHGNDAEDDRGRNIDEGTGNRALPWQVKGLKAE